MAELVAGAFLSSFFQVTLERLASIDFTDYFRRRKLDKLVNNLESTLSSIDQVLDDADIKQYQSPYVKKWLGDVKHAMYEADQLLDEIATDAPLKKLKLAEPQHASSSSNLFSFIPSFTNPFESRIKELLKNLDSLAEQKDVLGLEQGTSTCASNEGVVSWKPSKRLPTTSLVVESSTYGRAGDKEEIINFLLSGNDSGNQAQVISIVGLGGMGKTTLAQLVYNDRRMQEQFELKAWVYVSESFDVFGLTKVILRLFQSSADGEDLNQLQHQLQQTLMGKKYLLVLDDVWNGNGECWERLLLPFNLGSSRSKIIVTTRDKEVASIMKSTKLLHLKPLEESECWTLFMRHAFQGKDASEYQPLESIGKRIVDKCGGLPLAIKTLGNLLRRKFSQREWLKILEIDMWRLSENENNVNPVLILSYHNLPSNLKRCFACCSIFPRGYKFDKDELIKLWMAEGLLRCYRTESTSKNEEDLGNEFFNDLESISFFQQWSDKDFFMHDLINDLAKSVSEGFCLGIEGDRVQDIPKRTRHIRWCSLKVKGGHKKLKDGHKTLQHVYKIKGLRSLLMVQIQAFSSPSLKICSNVQRDMFSRLQHLRMLSFSACNLLELVDEISNLKLLRYLDLSKNRITRLPDSICMLHNLQTLILSFCILTELPLEFYKLINLRHLHLTSTLLKKMPNQIGSLNHLQTLTDFVVGKHKGSDIKELANLDHLQGTLHISGLEYVIHPVDAAEANLKDKKHLEELQMMYSHNRRIDGSIIERDVLEALQPNSNLNKLVIQDYRATSFPDWLGGSHLPNLVSLRLRRCICCSQLPPIGNLPFLKSLSVSGCHGIEIIGTEFYGNNSSNIVAFKSLEFLEFWEMHNWKEWLCLEGFPLLKELTIKYCPKFKGALPQHLPSLQKLVIWECRQLEASIPKAANLSELRLEGCEKILVKELSSNLKRVDLRGTRVIESSLEQILFNNAFLEMLNVRDFNGTANPECSSLHLRSCNSLLTLKIEEWRSSSFPVALDLFTNLHSLHLFKCPQLKWAPGVGLPSSLSNLTIDKCPKLIASREEWGLFNLHSLKQFRVCDDFENVESFPEESLLPPNLNSLYISICPKLRVINERGLHHLKSLKHLDIYNCPCLERLPEEGLPNSLSTLRLYGCPLLKHQYEKEKGERWHKISHIPSVTIS